MTKQNAIRLGCAGALTGLFMAPGFGCSSPPQPTPSNPRAHETPSPAFLSAAEKPIYAAVLREFAGRRITGEPGAPEVVFLGITPRGLDPSPEFLEMLSSAGLPVRPASAAYRTLENDLRDEETGRRGVFITMERLEWLSSDRARVHVVWYDVGPTARGSAVVLHAENGQWRLAGPWRE